MKEEKPIARNIYFPPKLKSELQEIADSFGTRQFNRVVNDACREYVERRNEKANTKSN